MDGSVIAHAGVWLEAALFAPASAVVLWSIGRALRDRRRHDTDRREAT